MSVLDLTYPPRVGGEDTLRCLNRLCAWSLCSAACRPQLQQLHDQRIAPDPLVRDAGRCGAQHGGLGRLRDLLPWRALDRWPPPGTGANTHLCRV
jgi:hypothetical protein